MSKPERANTAGVSHSGAAILYNSVAFPLTIKLKVAIPTHLFLGRYPREIKYMSTLKHRQ